MMRTIRVLVLAFGTLLVLPTVQAQQSAERALPADVDPESLSRLPSVTVHGR